MMLHNYQEKAIARALEAPGKRWLFNDEMGLGKTAEAIYALQRVGANNILIVCPAIVRSNWLKELDKWWPKHPEVGLIHAGLANSSISKKKRLVLERAYDAPIQVVSYNLLDKIQRQFWDAIVADEVHRCKEPKTRWYQTLRKLTSRNKCPVFGMTATSMPNSPLDFCGIAEVIWPGRFGGVHDHWGLSKKCKTRYSNEVNNGYGSKYVGVNQLFVDELAFRVGAMSSRTTKLDVLDLLPAFDVVYDTVEAELPTFDNIDELGDLLTLAARAKFDYISDWAKYNSATHICIMTHKRMTAKQIAKLFDKSDRVVYRIDGSITPEKRNEMLAQAAQQERALVVATMHSCGIGIDLTFCTSALFAELYYRPETVVQALGRFSRLSGKVPSNVLILSVRNSVDEIVATKLQEKLEAINKAVEAGLSEQELVSSLDSEEDFTDLIMQTLNSKTEEDLYEYDYED